MRIIKATWDGDVLRLDEHLPLAPGARVTLTVHVDDPAAEPAETALRSSEQGDRHEKTSLASAVRRYKVRGPSDWSDRVDYYLGQDLSRAGE